jgi:hypothetical protein
VKQAIAFIEESRDLSVLTIDKLFGSLKSHEDMMKIYNENSLENVLYTTLQFFKEKTSGSSKSPSNPTKSEVPVSPHKS